MQHAACSMQHAQDFIDYSRFVECLARLAADRAVAPDAPVDAAHFVAVGADAPQRERVQAERAHRRAVRR